MHGTAVTRSRHSRRVAQTPLRTRRRRLAAEARLLQTPGPADALRDHAHIPRNWLSTSVPLQG